MVRPIRHGIEDVDAQAAQALRYMSEALLLLKPTSGSFVEEAIAL